MVIRLSVQRTIAAPVEVVFAAAADPLRFPRWFTGCGPVPALRAIELHAPPAVGTCRTLHHGDGSQARETITVWAPPLRHAYRLDGLAAPVRWLLCEADADWQFETVDRGTRVQWHYRWTLASALAWPIAWPLLHGFMRTAMRRCLAALAIDVEAQRAALADEAALPEPR